MKELPILFTGAMVRALLDGRKTQTRRIINPQPEMVVDHAIYPWEGEPAALMQLLKQAKRTCPYGQPGDRLWVRETWGVVSNTWGENGEIADWTPDRPAKAIREMRFGQGYYSGHAIFAADGSFTWAGNDDGGGEPRSAWHPSIHMPRAASRILLEITGVRVERLQNISRGDAMDEGCPFPNMTQGDDPRKWYADLWESINGAGSWALNPWVWVVEFRHITNEASHVSN